jgi:hypothetical protein
LRRRRLLRSAVVAPFALVFACGDDDAGKTAAERAMEDNAVVLCDRLFSCCTPAELGALAFVDEKSPPTHEGCIAYHQKTAREYVELTNAEAAAGRVALHLDRSGACVAERRGESCSAFHARLPRLHLGDAYALCNGAVVEPLVADESRCRLYLDCKSGNCEGASADTASPEPAGTCKPIPKDGEPCAVDGCAEGLRCDPDTTRCAPLVQKGGSCLADDACASGACRGGRCVSPGRCGG